nr:MAG TPA: hypothetical protein [Caudoviricetes sp.]
MLSLSGPTKPLVMTGIFYALLSFSEPLVMGR